MNLLSSLLLLGSLALTLAQSPECSGPEPGAVNLARNGEATQSSDYQFRVMGYASNAIDGNRDRDYYHGSCTHTNVEDTPWWLVNLKQAYKITYIVIVSRGDCCKERLKGAEMRVGDSPDINNPVCALISVVSEIMTFCCYGMIGQYVSVVLPEITQSMTLCEVEIYGEPVTGYYY